MNPNDSAKDNPEDMRENPPAEWVKLRKNEMDSYSEGDYAKAFCTFIAKFCWRSREDKPDELHVVMFNEDSPNKRYKYTSVPKEVYDEMWERSYFPEDFGRPIGVWFGQKIKGNYEYEDYSDKI